MKVHVDSRRDPKYDQLRGNERIARINLAEAYEIVEAVRLAGKIELARRLELLFHLDSVADRAES